VRADDQSPLLVPRPGPPLVAGLFCVLILATAANALTPARGQAAGLDWSGSLAGGYDLFVNRFPLATEDTTETVSEWMTVLGVEACTAPRSRHAWSLHPELSVGTQLVRERLEVGYQYRPDSSAAVMRGDLRWYAHQYQRGTEYELSSDQQEGRAEAHWAPLAGRAVTPELRGHAEYLRYQDPSTLEVDHDEAGLGAFLRSGFRAERRFALGTRYARRTYPDSAAIDRTTLSAEAEYEGFDWRGAGWRLFHRSDRRTHRQQVRPDAWSHWTELAAGYPLGASLLGIELRSEVWRYDQETAAYFDSWRLESLFYYRAGEPLELSWQLGAALERMAAGSDSPESYDQYGLRTGVERFGGDLSGSLLVEFGRRDYVLTDAQTGYTPAAEASSALDPVLYYGYSDFMYWKIWLMASWLFSEHLSADLMAHYQPESHTEAEDDAATAFASARLVWRW
jgi:hypothetical protein